MDHQTDPREEFERALELVVANKGYVSKYYEMDPETDDLIANGEQLENGMRVICEDPDPKNDLDTMQSGDRQWWNIGITRERANRWNRWMTVSEVIPGDEITEFVGVYDDGTKKKFNVASLVGWYVKKDSLETVRQAEEAFAEIVREELDQRTFGSPWNKDQGTGLDGMELEMDRLKAEETNPPATETQDLSWVKPLPEELINKPKAGDVYIQTVDINKPHDH